MLDSCVICGQYVPEGRQVCRACELEIGGDDCEDDGRGVYRADEAQGYYRASSQEKQISEPAGPG